jgi:hypothetical protein
MSRAAGNHRRLESKLHLLFMYFHASTNYFK